MILGEAKFELPDPKQPNCEKIGTRLILGMAETREDEIRQLVDRVYRAESSRILATLIRLLGEFDLAEEAMQDAFAAALVRCSRDGAPENPRAWLVSTAFLIAASTLAQGVVRAKAKIREARIPFEVPSPAELPERLNTVLQVIYLVFNEGYSASFGESVTRADLSSEAIRLKRLLKELIPEPEVTGLLALMLLQESRRAARTSPERNLILLENQDRSLWNRPLIEEGVALVERALNSHRFGSYTLQAAIAAVHSQAASAAATDWSQIVLLYGALARIDSSPVVELNRAVAIAMRDGPEAGLRLIDALVAAGELAGYHLAHAARADLCRRLGKTAEARSSYEKSASSHPTRTGTAISRKSAQGTKK